MVDPFIANASIQALAMVSLVAGVLIGFGLRSAIVYVQTRDESPAVKRSKTRERLETRR